MENKELKDKELKDKELKEYRKHLILAGQKAQEDFDKTVIVLSGGALGISFAFIKDYIGENPIIDQSYLLVAWICWGLSVTVILISYYFSICALNQAVDQVDTNTINQERPGKIYSILTAICNALGGILFFVGVVCIILFAKNNLVERRTHHGTEQRGIVQGQTGTSPAGSSK